MALSWCKGDTPWPLDNRDHFHLGRDSTFEATLLEGCPFMLGKLREIALCHLDII